MPYVLVRHKVTDFSRWKLGYDGHIGARNAAGLKEVYVLRNNENSNEVFILFETSDLKKAQEFASSADLKETMVKAGVIDKPDVYLLGK
jgi:hypothetical protein